MVVHVRAHTRGKPSRTRNTGLGGLAAGAAIVGLIVFWPSDLTASLGPLFKGDDPALTWRRGPTTFTVLESAQSTTCRPHAFGRVRGFFADHECTSLQRALVQAEHGRATAAVAISWVRFADYASARRFKALVDTHGTGNIRDLNRQRQQFLGLSFSGRHYDSRVHETTVVIAESEQWKGGLSAHGLGRIAARAVHHPLPR